MERSLARWGLRTGLVLVLGWAGLAGGGQARAEPLAAGSVPVQVALLTPAQVFGPGSSVTGLDVSGFGSRTHGDQRGLQLGIYNEVDGDLDGVQISAGASDVGGRARGAQLAAFYAVAGEGTGAQLSGLHSRAGRWRGLQISLVNWADDLEGVQIGLVNVNRAGWIPVLPGLNFGF